MSKQPEKKPEQKKMGLFGACFWILSKLILWTVLGWCITLIVASLILLIMGHQTANTYVANLLQGQLRYLGANSNHSLIIGNPLNFVVGFAHQLYQWIFIKTHLINLFSQQKVHLTSNDSVNQIVGMAYPVLSSYMQLLITTVELMSVKLAVTILAIPCFALFGITGLVHGIVQRDLRKFGGGRESALLYHQAKSKVYPIFIIGCLLYLILPFDIAPEFIFLPFAMLFGYSIAVMARTFKKYV